MAIKECDEYAMVFSESDLKNDFIGCMLSVLNEGGSETTLLARSADRYTQVAVINESFSGGRPNGSLEIHYNLEGMAALELSEIPTTVIQMAMLLQREMPNVFNLSDAFNAAQIIEDNFKISE